MKYSFECYGKWLTFDSDGIDDSMLSLEFMNAAKLCMAHDPMGLELLEPFLEMHWIASNVMGIEQLEGGTPLDEVIAARVSITGADFTNYYPIPAVSVRSTIDLELADGLDEESLDEWEDAYDRLDSGICFQWSHKIFKNDVQVDWSNAQTGHSGLGMHLLHE